MFERVFIIKPFSALKEHLLVPLNGVKSMVLVDMSNAVTLLSFQSKACTCRSNGEAIVFSNNRYLPSFVNPKTSVTSQFPLVICLMMGRLFANLNR